MGNDYRTGDNGRMKACLFALLICLFPPLAHAWNAAGHRLVAAIAWQQLTPETQEKMITALTRHPDHGHWVEKAKTNTPAAIFCEASTWPDSIRNDPRFFDETRESPTEAIPGLHDNARHKRWHYVDIDTDGKTAQGELDQQIERLSQLLRSTHNPEEISWALPWLLHLVADIHQPMHVGHAQDEGGNLVEIENPLKPKQPFGNLHRYWDDLPGPSALRGKRLENAVTGLLERNKAPKQGDVALWRKESQQWLKQAYPDSVGSLLPIITETFDSNAHAIAEHRLVDAGYRLGRLLESIFSRRVSRETH